MSRLNARRVPGSGSSCRGVRFGGRFLSSFLAAPSPPHPLSLPELAEGRHQTPVQPHDPVLDTRPFLLMGWRKRVSQGR